MTKWNEVTERWLPLVEEMERMGFEDYATPELYRAAETHIDRLKLINIELLNTLESVNAVFVTTHENININVSWIRNKVGQAIEAANAP